MLGRGPSLEAASVAGCGSGRGEPEPAGRACVRMGVTLWRGVGLGSDHTLNVVIILRATGSH